MFERSARGFILLSLFVNAIAGSPWDEDEETRNPRHASCPSCRRERPDTLVSWSAPAARGGYYGHEPETSSRQASELFRSNPTFQSPNDSPFNNAYSPSYDRAIRSRGAPPVTKPTATGKREDPFTIGRDLDSHVAPSQTASIHDINNPISPYHSHFPVSRTPSRTPYRRANFYDLAKSQSDLTPSNQPSFGNLRRQSSVLFNNEDETRSFGPRKVFTVSQSGLIPYNQLYADYGLVNREPSFGDRRQSSILVNNGENLRNFGARKQFTIGTRSDDYFDDLVGHDSPNELSPFGTFRRSLNPLIGNEGNSRSFRSNFDNELSFNNLRGPSVHREDLKNFGVNPRSDRYLSDSFERSNPMSESDQYPGTELNQFSKAGSSQFFRAEPRQYTKVQPSQFARIEPGQFFRAEPKQFSRTEPNQFPHVQPSQSFKFEPGQLPKVVEPSQFSKVQSNQFSKAEASQYLRTQSNEYSVAENPGVSYEREVTRPQFVQSQRSETLEGTNRPVYVPEVKHNSYNLPEELNVFGMTQEVEVDNSSRWEKQSDEQKKDQGSYQGMEETSERMGSEMYGGEMHDYQNNEELKSRDVTQQREIKRKGDVGKDNSSGDKSGFSGNRSLGEDSSSNSRLMERSEKIEGEESTTKTMSGV
ncbi:hypothetical protein E2986_06473 [Frieseomelitta varia]|uniref:Uncharacterized protein n=1 Tax=Frieseomelitta varia TaxID=561572 RepID=A0A833S661_9HYME|nr:uncharacterized protein LOC122531296 [Frieseomelitta varia]KAF3425450.1 hypothetical protein E2986_06473 [Frieseomelitta varia]